MTYPNAPVNPFQVTKAVDYTDEEIVRTWVDLAGGGGFYGLASPISRMPLVLLGGKGSGRTHLMRYFSAASQQIRNPDSILESLVRDGYIGIYIRCSGLNSGRFEGKGQSNEAWADVFSYYTDLWFAEYTLGTLTDLLGMTDAFANAQERIARGTLRLFNLAPELDVMDVPSLTGALHELQRELDIAINNAALSRELPVNIRATRGALILDLPAVLVDAMPELRPVQFTYLIDELENLSTSQQQYINTLLREKKRPCGFIIGSRLYGIRTRATYSSGEENREGSEFENVYLDRTYLRDRDRYGEFCRNVAVRRLIDAGYTIKGSEDLHPKLDDYFEVTIDDRLGGSEAAFVLDRPAGERVYISKLRRKLEYGLQRRRVPGLGQLSDIDTVLAAISVPRYPLVEKLNTFLLYQDWYRQRDLIEAAAAISEEAKQYIQGKKSPRHETQMGLFRSDLMAQLLREYDYKQRYLGFGTFVHMSSGLPRNLMIILKNIFRWAIFNGEEPFSGKRISAPSQREGVLQSANWFYEDAPGVGDLGRDAQAAIDRLARLMRNLRFADKPVESSLSTFSVDLNAVTPRAREVIRASEQWSMILPIDEGQRDRNTGAVLHKFQISGMLAPRWDLPIYRRGSLALRVDETNVIFDSAYRNEYGSLERTRVGRLTAPFFGGRGAGDSDDDSRLF